MSDDAEVPEGFDAVVLSTIDGDSFEALIPTESGKTPVFVHNDKPYLVRGLKDGTLLMDAALSARFDAVKNEVKRRAVEHDREAVDNGQMPERVKAGVATETIKSLQRRLGDDRAKQIIKRQARDMATKGMPDVESLWELLHRKIDTGDPLVMDPDGGVLLRRGEDGREVGLQKAGKTEAAGRELVYSLVTGEKFIGYYEVARLADDEIVVILDAENNDFDRQKQWSPFKDRMTKEQWDRIVHVALDRVPCDIYDPDFREWLDKRYGHQIRGRRVGLLVLDSLTSLGSLSSEELFDTRNATSLRVEVLGWFRENWSAETSLTLMHTPRGQAAKGADVLPYGGEHWDQQLSPHWVYNFANANRRGARVFEATPARGGTGTPMVYVVMDENDRLTVDLTRVEEAGEAASMTPAQKREKEKTEKAAGDRLKMAMNVKTVISRQNLKGEYPSLGDVRRLVGGNYKLIGEVVASLLDKGELTDRNDGNPRVARPYALEVTVPTVPELT